MKERLKDLMARGVRVVSAVCTLHCDVRDKLSAYQTLSRTPSLSPVNNESQAALASATTPALPNATMTHIIVLLKFLENVE